MRTFICIATLLFCAFFVRSQDIHHTLFWLIPSNTNSALVGENFGTNIGVIHRNQYFTVTPNIFVRNSVSVDHSLSSKWGVGLNLHNSKSGDAGVRYNSLQGLLSYKIPISKLDYFRLGSRIGIGLFETVNIGNLRFENDLLNIPNSESIPSERPFSYRAGAGLLYHKSLGKSHLQFGFDTRYNWLSSLYQDGYINNPKWLNIYNIRYLKPLTKATKVNIRAWYQTLNKAYELQANTIFETKLDKKKSDIIMYGVGYRYKDALQYIVGYKNRSYTAMIAYDHNISNLVQASRGVGAIELGANIFIAKKAKKINRPITLINILPRLSLRTIDLPKYYLKDPIVPPILSKTHQINLVFEGITDLTKINLKYGILDTSIMIEQGSTFEIPNLDKVTSILISSEDFNDIIVQKEIRPKVPESNYIIEFIRKSTPIQFDPIYYDFDLSIIRNDQEHPLDAIYEAMIQNPKMQVQFNAYTDNRGTLDYNLSLSKQRSLSAKQYLVQKGISSNRITPNFHGESNPAFDCTFNNCTEVEHALNRRTEVKILYKDQ